MPQEGFWYSKKEPNFPMPIGNNKPWIGQSEFLDCLRKVQKNAKEKEKIGYKGFSFCRLCEEERNGSDEYRIDGWEFPEGLIHYIEIHNVKPSQKFIEFILKKTRMLDLQ